MPGCKDKCYLYWEEHSLDYLDKESQILSEQELEKFNKGEHYDPSLLTFVRKRRCLAGYRKDSEDLRENCKYFWEKHSDISPEECLKIWREKQKKDET